MIRRLKVAFPDGMILDSCWLINSTVDSEGPFIYFFLLIKLTSLGQEDELPRIIYLLQGSREGVDLPIKLCIIEINNKINLPPCNFFCIKTEIDVNNEKMLD
jgi:hypothetical protein